MAETMIKAEKTFAEKQVYSIGLGVLMVCLAEKLTCSDIEPLAQGILAWWRELAPEAPVQFIFRDSSFVNDVDKINLTSILEQSIPAKQLYSIRSL